MRWAEPTAPGNWPEKDWQRFVDGRPVSRLTTAYLAWDCANLAAWGKTALLLVWDTAAADISRQGHRWIRCHNRNVELAGQGVRFLTSLLSIQSPWLSPVEPKRAHGKRRIIEPTRRLTASELIEGVCTAGASPHYPHLSLATTPASSPTIATCHLTLL